MSPDLLIAAMVLGSANPMKRLLSSLVMTGLVVAAATTSAFVVAQVAPPAAEKTKTAKPVAGADLPKQVVAKAKGVAKNKGEAKQAETVKLKEAAVKQAIVARKARVAAKVANGNANLNPMIQQFTQQGRPMMRSEVLLANSLFHLTKDQLRGLVKGAEAALEKVAKEMAEYQQGGMPRMAVRGQASRNPDWAKKLQDTIAVEIKKQLKPEQFRTTNPRSTHAPPSASKPVSASWWMPLIASSSFPPGSATSSWRRWATTGTGAGPCISSTSCSVTGSSPRRSTGS